MKIQAINKVISLQTESSLEEVLQHLDMLNNNNNSVINLTSYYNTVKEQYSDVLKKLAQ
jgi:hypothetical protein